MKKVWAWLFALGIGGLLPGVILKIMPVQKMQNVTDETSVVQEETSIVYLKLMDADGTIHDIPLEEYVLGVVQAEMPADFELEALKAQAVLVRTYGLRRQQVGDKHPQGALCMESACCQAYNPGSVEGDSLEKIKVAVESTAREVLTYNGELIEATYFSCSGGSTEDAAAVWGTDVPYLQATDSPGEESSKHYVTTTQMSLSDFASALGVDLQHGGVGQPVYTDGGGIATVAIGGKEFTGIQLRKLLNLKSTSIRMSIVGDHIIITTKGYGHRVGMSQYGADTMAVAGSTYEQILAHYYKDTVLTQYLP